MKISLLLVEDDELFGATLVDFLEEEGFSPLWVKSATGGYEALFSQKFDIWILDIGLPDENGLDFLRQLRQSGDDTPALFLTSYPDKLKMAFANGCDDYLKKPVDLDELSLRLHALLRRRMKTTFERISLGEGYFFDIKTKGLYCSDNVVQLSPKEAELLTLFVEYQGENILTQTICDRLWHTDEEASSGALRVYVAGLKKIFGERIVNLRGVGYRFERK